MFNKTARKITAITLGLVAATAITATTAPAMAKGEVWWPSTSTDGTIQPCGYTSNIKVPVNDIAIVCFQKITPTYSGLEAINTAPGWSHSVKKAGGADSYGASTKVIVEFRNTRTGDEVDFTYVNGAASIS